MSSDITNIRWGKFPKPSTLPEEVLKQLQFFNDDPSLDWCNFFACDEEWLLVRIEDEIFISKVVHHANG
jgi:hypothetical protein